MTSDRRRATNRANAQRSTGPRTPAGKARAAANAVRHGVTAGLRSDHEDQEVVRLTATYRPLVNDAASAQRAAQAHTHLQRTKAAKLHSLQLAVAQLRTTLPNATPEELEGAALLQIAAELRKLGEYERKARSRLKTALRRR